MRKTALCAAAVAMLSLQAEVTYQKPPKEILDVLNAPPAPAPSISPDKTHVLLMQRALYPSIAVLAAPVLRIAGMRINPANNGPHVPPGVLTSMVMKNIATGAETRIQAPAGARLDSPVWSPDGKMFVVTNVTDTSVDLYVGTVGSAVLRRVPGVALNDTIGLPVVWLAGSKELLVRMVPAGRGPAPKQPAAPAGPNVQESAGQSGRCRRIRTC